MKLNIQNIEYSVRFGCFLDDRVREVARSEGLVAAQVTDKKTGKTRLWYKNTRKIHHSAFTVCAIMRDGKHAAAGITWCSSKDHYSKALGKEKAFSRAIQALFPNYMDLTDFPHVDDHRHLRAEGMIMFFLHEKQYLRAQRTISTMPKFFDTLDSKQISEITS